MPFTIGPKPHHAIPKTLKVLIEDFFKLRDWQGLYLTGGTCLAEYYFGHRISEDIDLFTRDENLFKEARTFFKDPKSFPHGTLSESRTTPYICQYLYRPNSQENPIKLDLVLDLVPYIGEPISVSGVWVNNLEDLLSNKIGCLISRNEVKDYLDLFQLIPASHLTVRELMELGSVKEAGLDPLVFAHQIEFILKQDPPEPALLGIAKWEELQLFFRRLQKECWDLIRPWV